jgi:branched-chain amino acid transport system substrate-binding protein
VANFGIGTLTFQQNRGKEIVMPRSISLNRRQLLAVAAAGATSLAAPAVVRAEAGDSGPLRVGVLLPRSGFEAGIGQDCQRGVDVAPAIL